MTLRLLPARAEPNDAAIGCAAELLRRGHVVAFPTETVYGLGAHAFCGDAVTAVFRAKGRPADNPLIVHLADAADLPEVVAEVTPLARTLAAAHWPGPLTLVLTARPDLPTETTGGLATVGVRVPAHEVARALCRAAGPLAAPSANRSGRPSPTTADHVLHDLGGTIAAVVDAGQCRVGVESTVVDARGVRPLVLREGGLNRDELAVTPATGPDASRLSPGTRYRHYRPECEVVIAPQGEGPEVAAALATTCGRVGLVAPGTAPAGVRQLANPATPEDLGRVFYAALRTAEAEGLDAVVVEAVAEQGLGAAVMDRLRRAAG